MAEKIAPNILRELLSYDPETGMLTWLPRRAKHFTDGEHQTAEHKCAAWNARFANTTALHHPNAEGYRHGRIFGRDVQTHRVIWALHYGEWPNGIIDHISGDRADNRIANLRVVDPTGNCRNTARTRQNKSGVSGVFWHNRDKKWSVTIRTGNGGREYLGYFTNFEEAVAARKEAERRHNYHPNHGREARAS